LAGLMLMSLWSLRTAPLVATRWVTSLARENSRIRTLPKPGRTCVPAGMKRPVFRRRSSSWWSDKAGLIHLTITSLDRAVSSQDWVPRGTQWYRLATARLTDRSLRCGWVNMSEEAPRCGGVGFLPEVPPLGLRCGGEGAVMLGADRRLWTLPVRAGGPCPLASLGCD
jgi:hypothetical protein